MEIGVEPREQVFGRRLCAYRTGEDSTFTRSCVDGIQRSPVALYKSALLIRRKREHGVVHPQRSGDLGSDQFRIRYPGALCESVSEQADPHAAVEILRVRGFRGAVPRKEVVQRDAVVVGKWVAGILRHEIVGNAGQPGAMSREVEQGDFY